MHSRHDSFFTRMFTTTWPRGVSILFALATVVALTVGACADDADEPDSRRAELVTVTSVSGNPTCGDFNSNWEELKLEGETLANGTYSSPDGYLDFTLSNYDGQSFDWSSTEGIDAVFVKGGPGGNLYEYDPEETSDVGLTAHRDDKTYGVSHISICYDVEFARISITPDDVNEVSDPHTFDVLVEQKIGFDGTWTPAADGTIVDVTLTPANGASVNLSDDTCASPGTTSGACSVTFYSDTAGLITGHAEATVNVGGSNLFVQTDGSDGSSGSAVKRYVDAAISIAPSATNEIGDYHTFTVTATQNDGSGSSSPVPDGTIIDVTLANANGASYQDVTDTCASGTTSGTCTVKFRSMTAGTVTGSASMTLDVSGLTLSRSTDGTGANSSPAVKTFVDAWITISPNDVNEVGEFHTFTVTAMQNDGSGSPSPVPDGTLVTVTLTESDGAVVTDKTDTCASGTVSGLCSVTFRSHSAGFIKGHASMTLSIGGESVSRETDGIAPNSGDATKQYVDAAITISGDDTNGIGEPHTFTVNVTADSGGGASAVSDGTPVLVILTSSGGAAAATSSDGCASGTLAGACEVKFNSGTAGTITGTATVTLNIGGVTLTRTTDGIAPNSGPATKVYVDGSLTWFKEDAETKLPLAGATFEVCRTHDWNSATMSYDSLTTPDCVTVLDNSAPDANPGDGEFHLENLILGTYTIEETQAPAGYILDPTVVTVNLSTSSPDHTVSTPFSNIPDRDEGCTPGFWRNHTELWDDGSDAIAAAAGFTTSTSFNTFFNLTSAQSGFSDSYTMDDAINARGGQGNKLARHGVAALLNIAASLSYEYSDATALYNMIRDAYINDTFEPLATNLNDANEQDCPLGN